MLIKMMEIHPSVVGMEEDGSMYFLSDGGRVFNLFHIKDYGNGCKFELCEVILEEGLKNE